MPGPTTRPGLQGQANQELDDFANAVAAATGLDPRVVYAWGMIETGGQPYGGYHNWLNLRPYPGDPYSGVSPGNFEEYSSVQNAEQAAIRRLRQPFASGILASQGMSPAQEISAIAASGWDAGHYGGAGGPTLLHEFEHLYPGASTGAATTAPLSGGKGVGNPIDAIGGALGHPIGKIEKLVIRGALILVGAGIALLGLYFIVRALGAPAIPVADTATRFITRGKAGAKSPPRKGDAAIERGAEVTRTGPPERRTRADKRAAKGNELRRQSAENARRAARDKAFGGDDDIPF